MERVILLRRGKPDLLPVYVAPSAAGDLVAFGEPSALELLGKAVEAVPGPFVRAFHSAVALSGDAAAIAQSATGSVLHLTKESRELLANYDPIESGGAILGVLRDRDGKIVHQLKFLKPGAAVAAGLPSLMTGVAVQQQMAGIERKLGEIQAGVDYLTKGLHIEAASEIAAALEILSTTYDDVMSHAEMTDDQWMRVANVELPVKRLQLQTLSHLRSFTEALDTDDVPMPKRVKRLEQALRAEHADVWISLHLQADRALTQWESLTLLRRVDNHPERAQALVETMTANLQSRHETMVSLATSMTNYIHTSDKPPRLLDRIRFLTLWRHERLLKDLGSILTTYRTSAELLGLPMSPNETPELPVAEEFSALALLTSAMAGSRRAVATAKDVIVERAPRLPMLPGHKSDGEQTSAEVEPDDDDDGWPEVVRFTSRSR